MRKNRKKRHYLPWNARYFACGYRVDSPRGRGMTRHTKSRVHVTCLTCLENLPHMKDPKRPWRLWDRIKVYGWYIARYPYYHWRSPAKRGPAPVYDAWDWKLFQLERSLGMDNTTKYEKEHPEHMAHY